MWFCFTIKFSELPEIKLWESRESIKLMVLCLYSRYVPKHGVQSVPAKLQNILGTPGPYQVETQKCSGSVLKMFQNVSLATSLRWTFGNPRKW